MDNKTAFNRVPMTDTEGDKASLIKNFPTDMSLNPLLFETTDYNHSEFLQKQGEIKLLQGNIKGIKFFDLAAGLDSQNHELFYRQGLALFEYGAETGTKKYLLLANKKFKTAAKLLPEYFNAWQAWGNTLFHLAKTFGNHHFYLEANEKFQEAIKHSGGQSDDDLAQLYWDHGQVIIGIAEHSEEVFDLNAALDAHAKASSLNEQLPAKFWQDFGKISLKLGIQINDIRLYLKAINCQKNAIAKSVSCYESWYYLAEALAHLYQLTHDEDHFCQANECFTNAAKLHPENNLIWTTWAELLLNSGKRLKDARRLHSALEKCHRSYSCNRKDEKIIVLWAEVLANLGLLTDRLDLIGEASNKIAEAIESFGETGEVCYAHGIVLFAFGRYYNEVDYYYQAIEKFQEGLSINRINHKLWFHLGYTYRIIADIESDPSLYERAGKFFSRAINLQSESTYFYEYALSCLKLAEFNQEKATLEKAHLHFEQAFSLQKNAVYLHPEWLFQYAISLDLMGDFLQEDKYYIKSIEILKRVLMLDPDFSEIHYKLALTYAHLGELSLEPEVYQRAISHYKIAYQKSEENEQLILDWSLALINLAEVTPSSDDREQLWKEAEYKLVQSAKLGNTEVYYHLSCLYSITRQYEKAMYFLEKAEQFDALPPLDEVLEDIWLENLRQTEIFKSFISHLQA